MNSSTVGLAWLAFACLIACEDEAEPSYAVGPGGPGPNSSMNGGAGGSAPMGPQPDSGVGSMYYPEPDGGFPACGADMEFATLTLDGVTYDLELSEVRYDVCQSSRSLTLVGCDVAQNVCFSLLVTGGATSQIHRVHLEDGGTEWVEESTVLTPLALPDPVPCQQAGSFAILLSSSVVAEPGESDAAVAVDPVDGSVGDADTLDAGAGDASTASNSAPELRLHLLVSENRCLI